MIIRVEHRKRFTVITDQALRDPQISFRATGLLAYLLSMPDGTRISCHRLGEAKREGRDAILTALGELEQAGYLIRQRIQTRNGTWQTACTLVESPSPENPDSVPENPQQPSPEKPNSVFQDSKYLIPLMNTGPSPLSAPDGAAPAQTATPTRMPDELRRHLPHRDDPEQPTEEAAS